MQNSGLYAVAAKPSTRGEGAERSEAAEVGRESLQNFMAVAKHEPLQHRQHQTAARRHCNNPAAAGNVPPHQSPDGDSSPEGRAFPHQEEKFFFTTKKLPHSGKLASSGREMTERVIPKQNRGKVL